MKYLLFCLMAVLEFVNGIQHHHTKIRQQTKPVIYFWKRDSLTFPYTVKHVLRMSYKSDNPNECHLAFRILLLHQNEPIPATINSDAYLCTVSLGMSCKGTFLIPVPERFEKRKGALVFMIIPLDRMAKMVNVDIQKNFSFDVSCRDLPCN